MCGNIEGHSVENNSEANIFFSQILKVAIDYTQSFYPAHTIYFVRCGSRTQVENIFHIIYA